MTFIWKPSEKFRQRTELFVYFHCKTIYNNKRAQRIRRKEKLVSWDYRKKTKTVTTFSDWNCLGFYRTRTEKSNLNKSNFFYFRLVITCSLTLALPPRSGPKAKRHVFHHTFHEILLWKLQKPLSKNFLIDHEFLILHVMRNLYFL